MENDLSRWAPLAGALCSVHCLLAPLTVAAVPAMGSPGVEWSLFGLAVLVTATSLFYGFRAHRRIAPAALALLSAVLWTGALLDGLPAVPEEPATIAAGLGLAAAALWSGRLLHLARCESCGCPAHPAPRLTPPGR